MTEVSVLDVRLHDRPIGTLTHVQGDRTLFAFNADYVADRDRPTLSLAFRDSFGELVTDFRPVQRVVPPFFSNLLPEGPLRRYLARKAGVNEGREFFLLWMLGQDLPGAVTVHPMDDEALPPGLDEAQPHANLANALRFSLAGVQLKFSALQNGDKYGGLTIPTEGVGGSWIVKLPSQQFEGVPENEFSMMTLARLMGMDVPDLNLVDLDKIAGLPEGVDELRGQAMAIRRFDRNPAGRVHMEDFAQVFDVYPDDKYDKATYRYIAKVLGIEVGDAAAAEFIRRLVFSTLIGNADMHLKNWSLIYPDGINPQLSPAYDLLTTIPYLKDDRAALKYSRTKVMAELSMDELRHLAARAGLSERLVLQTARETVNRFKDLWNAEKTNLPLSRQVTAAIDAFAPSVTLYGET